MKRHLQIFLSGVIVVAPFAITAYVIWWAGSGLDNLARRGISAIAPGAEDWLFPGAGMIGVLVVIYFVGLLMHWWAFRLGLGLVEGLLARVPVIKTIYEALRDVIGLFSSDTKRMGQVVRYHVPGTDIDLLGIRTSTSPPIGQENKVAVFVPMSYQWGGYTIYVPPETLRPVDMTVEQALKVAATAGAARVEPAAAEPAQGKGGA